MIREFVRSHSHALATLRLLARNLRSAAAEARRKRRLLKRIRYRGRQLAFRIPVREELHRRKEVRRIRIHHLFFWRIRLHYRWIGDSLAQKINRVGNRVSRGRRVAVQRNVLPLRELRNRNQGLQRERLVVNRSLAARHLLGKRAPLVELIHSVLVRLHAEVEQLLVRRNNAGGNRRQPPPVVMVVVVRHLTGKPIMRCATLFIQATSRAVSAPSSFASFSSTDSEVAIELSVHSTWYHDCAFSTAS